jgi:hypothetical protein
VAQSGDRLRHRTPGGQAREVGGQHGRPISELSGCFGQPVDSLGSRAPAGGGRVGATEHG